MVSLVAALIAFNMPTFHLVYIDHGQVVVNVEDMTLPECKARLKTFKKKAQATCALSIAEREYT